MELKYEHCTCPKIIKTNIPVSNEYRDFVLRTYTDTEVKREVRSYALYYCKLAIVVPCGHCEYCRSRIARLWAYRIVLEMHNPVEYSAHYFLTLTFRDRTTDTESDMWSHITCEDDHKAIYENVKRFLKRCRKLGYIDKGDKYFCVGEYGDTRKHGALVNTSKHRFHYHIVLFLKRDLPMYSNDILNEYAVTCADPMTGTGKNRRFKTLKELNAEKHFLDVWNSKRQLQKGSVSSKYDKPDDCILFASSVSAFGETAWYIGKYCTCSSIDKEDGYIPYHHQSKGLGEWYAKEHRHEIYDGKMRVLEDIRSNGYFYPIPRTWLKKYGNVLQQREDFLSSYPQFIEECTNRYGLDDSQVEMLNEFGITTCYDLLETQTRRKLSDSSVQRFTYAFATGLWRGYDQRKIKDLNADFSFRDLYPVGKSLARLIPCGYRFNGYFNTERGNTVACRPWNDRFQQCLETSFNLFFNGLW